MILEKRIPIKYWFNLIKWDLLIVLLFSTFIYFLSKYLVDLNIPVSVGAFLGTSISLLLSFKLSQSYERWWEARKIWGSIVNDSRTLVMQLKGFTQKANKDLTDRMAFRQIAWCYSLSQNLRNQDTTENINEFISEQELKSIKHQKNIPLALLDIQSQDLSNLYKEKSINDFQQIQIDTTLVKLCASMGMAERIKNTYFPKTYRLTLHMFIYIFLAALSFGLADIYGPIEILFLVLISIPLLLLEKVAYTIQDPFENKPSDTAMTSISRTIEINIKQQLGLDDIPEPISSDTYYIL